MCVGKSDLQVYKQKVKHLLYEHQNSLTSLKADHEMWLKMQAEESSKRELDLQKDKRNLKQESKEQVRLFQSPNIACGFCRDPGAQTICHAIACVKDIWVS